MTIRLQPWLGGGLLVYLVLLGWMAGCSQSTEDSAADKAAAGGSQDATDAPAGSQASAEVSPEQAAQTAAEAAERKRVQRELIESEIAKKPLLEGWEKPALALLLSGEQRGYFEPCGCTEIQSGGFARRDDLLQKMKARDWLVTGFDLGGLVRRSRRQSQIKFETMLAALKDMQYSGLGLGPAELRLGPDYLLSQHLFDPQQPDSGLPFLSANVVLYGTPDLGTPVRYRVLEVGDLRIGVTSVIGSKHIELLQAEGRLNDMSIIEPAEALQAVQQSWSDTKLDLRILLSYTSKDQSRKLAEQFSGFDLVLTTGGAEDPKAEPEVIGQTWMIDVGHKGKSVGVLGVYPDAEPRFRFELVNLDKFRFQDTDRMVEHMRFYQQRLKQEQLSAVELPIQYPTTTGARFVGAESCQDCHTKAFEHWQETPHAHAYESLKYARAGQTEYGIPRIHDPECLACHVTGWEPQKVLRFEGGFINPEFLTDQAQAARMKLLEGQQCESCHGPGSQHIALINDGEIDAAIKEVRVTLEQAKDRLCYSCHDVDNSPTFDFDEYWPQVAHPWRD